MEPEEEGGRGTDRCCEVRMLGCNKIRLKETMLCCDKKKKKAQKE